MSVRSVAVRLVGQPDRSRILSLSHVSEVIRRDGAALGVLYDSQFQLHRRLAEDIHILKVGPAGIL